MNWRNVRRNVRSIILGLVLGVLFVIALGAMGVASKAHADPIVGCKVDLWGFLGSERREICDGPRHSDGSWLRRRVEYVPAHYVPWSCYDFDCSGGYNVAYSETDRETYPVNDGNVLPDEPPHLGG